MSAAVFDAVGPSSAGASQASGATLSWSHTCSSSANRLLVVGVAVGAAPDTAINAAVTYNGVAMTGSAEVHSGGTTSGFVQFFSLVNPASGANTVAVTLTGTGSTTAAISAGSVSWTNVDQTTPLGTFATANDANTAGTAVSVGVPSTTSGNPVIDAMANGSGVNATVGAGQTLRWQRATNSSTRAGGGAQSTEVSTGGTVTMSYTLGASDHWAIIAVEIKGAATAFSGSATATMKLSATATGTKNVAGTASATMRLAATEAATKNVPAAPTATLKLSASAVGQRINLGLATLKLAASIAGTSHNSTSTVTATALRLSASDVGSGVHSGLATATLRLGASSTAGSARSGTVSATMRLAATETGAKKVPGAYTATLRLSASYNAAKNTPGSRTATLRLSASVSGLAGTRTAAATATLRLSASSTASSTRANTVTATALRLSASAAGAHTVVEVVAAALTAQAQLTVPYELVCVARIPQTSGPPNLLAVDPIDYTGLSFTDELSKPQTLSVGAKITNLTETVLQRVRNPSELATELWLYRNGKLIFAGPMLGWQVQGEAITFQAQGLLAYLKMMEVASDQVFKQVDQFTIAKALVDQWQALDYGNFGIDTSTVGGSGVLRDATYLAKELNNVQQRVFELGLRENGFDIEINPATRKLQLSFPLKGLDRSTGEDSIIFDSRNVTSPNVVCSVAPGDVASEAFGTGTGPATLYSVQSNLVRRAQYGRTAVAATFDGVTVQSTLDDHTLGFLNVRDQALLIPGPDTRVTPDADLASYDVGDTVSYQLHDQLGLSGAFRLRKRTVTVSKTGQESVSVAFA